jgi:hypothetical protein
MLRVQMGYITPNIQKPFSVNYRDPVHAGIVERKMAGMVQRQFERPVEGTIYYASMTNDSKGSMPVLFNKFLQTSD